MEEDNMKQLWADEKSTENKVREIIDWINQFEIINDKLIKKENIFSTKGDDGGNNG